MAREWYPRAAAWLQRAGIRESVEPELEGGLELLRYAVAALGIAAGERERIVSEPRAGATVPATPKGRVPDPAPPDDATPGRPVDSAAPRPTSPKPAAATYVAAEHVTQALDGMGTADSGPVRP